jgi:hypothetical protein
MAQPGDTEQPAGGTGTSPDRRRPGRHTFENQHLIGLLRDPANAPPEPESRPREVPPHGTLRPVVVAAVLTWGAVIALIWSV